MSTHRISKGGIASLILLFLALAGGAPSFAADGAASVCGCLAPPLPAVGELDFCTLVGETPDGENNLQALMQLIERIFPGGGAAGFKCSTADYNGHVDYIGEYWQKNGLPDFKFELALLQAVYNDPTYQVGDLTHQMVVDAITENYKMFYKYFQALADQNSEYSFLFTVTSNETYQMAVIAAGYAALGDTDTITALSTAIGLTWWFNIGIAPPSEWNTLSGGQYFGPDGDADGDLCTNREEYEEYIAVDDATAVANALDPTVHPHFCAMFRVTVPNVLRMTQAAAEAAIAGAGLAIGTVTQQYSDTVTPGAVISQYPLAGASALPGAPVNLAISDGLEPGVVPNVLGMLQTAAQGAIALAGLTVGAVTQQYSATIPAGAVLSISPVVGTRLSPGGPVNVSVSNGPQPVSVPNVVGMGQAEAQTVLASVGLAVGAVTQQYSAAVSTGSVIEQNPTAGGSAIPGAPVGLVLSAGPPLVSVLDVVGMSQTDAQAALTGAGLRANMVTHQHSAAVPEGQVISQDPAEGTSVSLGAAVSLVVSDGPRSCIPPSPPSNVSATDGTDSQGVHVTWTSAGAGIEYKILRSATERLDMAKAVSEWTAQTEFDDVTADTPAVSSGGWGCAAKTEFKSNYYWVVARYTGAVCQSAAAGPATGYRGVAETKELAAGVGLLSGPGFSDMLISAGLSAVFGFYGTRRRVREVLRSTR